MIGRCRKPFDVATWRSVGELYDGAGMAGWRRGPTKSTGAGGSAVYVRSADVDVRDSVRKGGAEGRVSASGSAVS